jgi:hypothetical protein
MTASLASHRPCGFVATAVMGTALVVTWVLPHLALAQCSPRWARHNPATAPPARDGHAMVYDAARHVEVLFGGRNGDDRLGDTWVWNGIDWAQEMPAAAPSARYGHAMAYDTARSVAVLFGDFLDSQNDTWEWDGSNWAQRTPPSAPPGRGYGAMAYDSARGVTVLFGGLDSRIERLNDTWEWDGANWAERTPVTVPAPRYAHAMAYDSTRGVTVLFGGRGVGAYLGDTWEWNGTDWVRRTPAISPSPRNAHAMAYDPSRGVTVLFGGFTTGAGGEDMYLSDTWEWDGTNWAQRASATSPAGRLGHAMAYYGAPRATMLFGGTESGGSDLNDTWTFSPQPGDFNCDGDVDFADFLHFQECFNGPNRPPQLPTCSDAELDADADVDFADFLIFQQCFNGPNRPPGCQ